MAYDDEGIELEDYWKAKETAKAVMFFDGDGKSVWIPKSQILRMDCSGVESLHDVVKQPVEQVDYLIVSKWFADKENL